jgi:hypothetical protein
VYQILNLPQAETEKRLLLDAGNLLFKRATIGKGPSQESLTAETILDIYKGLKYDAVGIGPLDLSGSMNLLFKSRDNGFPWVSANLFDINDKPLFKQWINRKIGDTAIYITALTARPSNNRSDIRILNTEVILQGLLEKIKKEGPEPFIILLSTLTNEENRHISEQYPEINLIIGADGHKSNISPKLINNCLLTQTGKQGKYQGLLEIILGNARKWGTGSAKQLADLQNKLGSLNWQLRRLEKKSKLPGNEERYIKTIVRLNTEKEEIDKQIASAKILLEQEETNGAVNDQYIYRFIGLKKNMPNDQPTVEKLKELNQKIRSLHKKSKQPKTISKLTKNMIGPPVCETCHEEQFKFWKGTSHSSAFATLVQKKKQLNLDCLPCHVTIDASNANFKIVTNKGYLSYPANLQSVGCESCHGPGKKHSADPENAILIRTPGKKTCLICHTSEHDDNFDYSLKINIMSCPSL